MAKQRTQDLPRIEVPTSRGGSAYLRIKSRVKFLANPEEERGLTDIIYWSTNAPQTNEIRVVTELTPDYAVFERPEPEGNKAYVLGTEKIPRFCILQE